MFNLIKMSKLTVKPSCWCWLRASVDLNHPKAAMISNIYLAMQCIYRGGGWRVSLTEPNVVMMPRWTRSVIHHHRIALLLIPTSSQGQGPHHDERMKSCVYDWCLVTGRVSTFLYGAGSRIGPIRLEVSGVTRGILKSLRWTEITSPVPAQHPAEGRTPTYLAT